MRNALDSLASIHHEVELLVSDCALARAWFEGVPAARLLARVQLHRREHDAESWDALVERLLGPDDLERVSRALGRNVRAAEDEGPLAAEGGVAALLMRAVLGASTSADASLGEIFDVDSAARAAAFEACVRLATSRSAGPWPQRRLLAAARALASSSLGPMLVTKDGGRLYPHDMDGADARMVLLDRKPLERLAARDPMELAHAVSALERSAGSPVALDTLIADVVRLLERGGDLVLSVPFVDPDLDGIAIATPSAPPSEVPASGMPMPMPMPIDWTQGDAAIAIANAVEGGALSPARVRRLVARGGEPALDAIGAEMLNVPYHPAASATFAELLAKSGRARDVIRLVTYFAVTPDRLVAARVLGECEAPELPAVLRAWLEAMLPSNGGLAPPGDDPGTSSAARVAACVSSLEPYPHLYGAVRPLLSRVSVAPAPPNG
jgi:hypothetical protein